MIKISGNILACLFHVIALLNATSLTATPDFHNVLLKSPNMNKYLFENQYQPQSKVSGGVFYERRHPGGIAEKGFAEVLQETLQKYDSRFSEGVNAYWTVAINLARILEGSKWHSYAMSLPVGIQTIKTKRPKHWTEERVRSWTDVEEFKVIVYCYITC